MLYTGYERRIRDYLEYHKRYFEAMNILGAKYFVLHGNKNPCPDEVVIDGYYRLNEVAKQFGVMVLQENVCRCTTGELSQLLKMKKTLGDDVGFVLDTKQAVRKGLDPYDFIAELGRSIKHVHFSDHGEKGDCLLPGEGDIDTPKFISALKDVGYEGAVMLELYRKNYKADDDLINSLKYLQGVIDDIA
jgi:sugar phosphate isomerase/epimerase